MNKYSKRQSIVKINHTPHEPGKDFLNRLQKSQYSGEVPTEKEKEIWMLNGDKFGYPQCCVDHFCLTTYYPPGYHIVNGKENRSGFVPCPDCRQKLVKGEVTLSDLIDYSIRSKRADKFVEVWK